MGTGRFLFLVISSTPFAMSNILFNVFIACPLIDVAKGIAYPMEGWTWLFGIVFVLPIFLLCSIIFLIALILACIPYTWDMGKYDLIHTKELSNASVCKAVLSAINKCNPTSGGY